MSSNSANLADGAYQSRASSSRLSQPYMAFDGVIGGAHNAIWRSENFYLYDSGIEWNYLPIS
eukprot:scaffold194025_cov27-Tisochrysis_lutea.AAC.1